LKCYHSSIVSAIVVDEERSPLLRRLVAHIDVIVARLDDLAAWRGFRVEGSGGTSDRLVCVDHLVTTPPEPREYLVSLHIFDGTDQGELHDHRWPLAVYPVGEGVPPGEPLYDMPWLDGDRSGTTIVRSGQPYAIERVSVQHAVRGLRPHISIVLADVTSPPSRENRLAVRPLDEAELRGALARARAALAR
jgi:hypothetical protein